MVNEDVIYNVYNFLRANPFLETATSLREQIKEHSPFLHGQIKNENLHEYMRYTASLKKSRRALVNLVTSSIIPLSKAFIKNLNEDAFRSIYQQEFSSELVFRVTKEFLYMTECSLYADFCKRFSETPSPNSRSIRPFSDTLSLKQASLNESTSLTKTPKETLDDSKKENNSKIMPLSLKKRNPSKKNNSSLKAKVDRLITTSLEKEASRKGPHSGSSKALSSLRTYDYLGNVLRDVEPYKTYIGKMPAFEIAELIEKENPALGESLRFSGSIIKGLDRIRFFGE